MKLRAERKLGEMLGIVDREKPGEYQKLQDVTFDPKPSLKELSITKIQSHRWQRLNDIPEGHLLRYLEECGDRREYTGRGC